MSSYSDAGAMADIYRQQQSRLRDYANAFAPQDFQIGAVFAIDDRVVGTDLFDAPATFRKFMSRLVESYAISAHRLPGSNRLSSACQHSK